VKPGEIEQCDSCKRRISLLHDTFFDGRDFHCIKCRLTAQNISSAAAGMLSQAQITEWLRDRKKR